MKTRNPVAKHARSFNKSAVHRDRKKDDRRGYQKHRKSRPNRGHEEADFWVSDMGIFGQNVKKAIFAPLKPAPALTS